MNETVKLRAADGHILDAYVSKPTTPPVVGLVVIQEIFGVNRHIRSVADNFAQHGFLAVAPALFDRIERGVDLGYEGEDLKHAYALYPKINIDDALKDTQAALDYAARQTGKPALIIGYCFGGTIAWLAATRLTPAAAVGYYGGKIVKFVAENPLVPVMLHFGRKDDHISESDIAKIEQAHPEVQIFMYDAGHAFNCDARGSYHPQSAQLALEWSLSFLKKHAGA
jgi:carboxymethylenebutenolidase